nr:MAG TPA: hypothetical protein [Caudoviricetes sp.]
MNYISIIDRFQGVNLLIFCEQKGKCPPFHA